MRIAQSYMDTKMAEAPLRSVVLVEEVPRKVIVGSSLVYIVLVSELISSILSNTF